MQHIQTGLSQLGNLNAFAQTATSATNGEIKTEDTKA